MFFVPINLESIGKYKIPKVYLTPIKNKYLKFRFIEPRIMSHNTTHNDEQIGCNALSMACTVKHGS